MRRIVNSSDIPPARRSGAALMEVLIAILAMGIGVVSLMSLFPLSVARTAQAHQLTVGTGFRQNVEAFIDNNRFIWVNPDRDNDIAEHAAETFLFDPLGIARGLTGNVGALSRYHGGFSTLSKALELSVYDGNWLTHTDESIVQNLAGASTLTLPTSNLTGVPTTGNVPSRIVLFDQAGITSTTRRITGITLPGTVNWDPTEPVTLDISRARVEISDEQFSWMFSFRRHDADFGNNPYGDLFLAVFFRREFSPDAETVFQNNGAAAPVFKSNSEIADLTYTPGNRPAIRKGGYVLDSENGYWYRISDYVENTDVNPPTIKMTLENPALRDSDGAVFFRGLVDVYYLGTQK